MERDGIDSLSGNSFHSPHIRPQDGWNFNRAVRLLVIFQDGHHGSPDSQSGPIERVDKVGLCLFLSSGWPILDARSPGLKRFEIAARRNLSVLLLRWEPYLNVVGLRSRKPHIPGAEAMTR